VNTGNENIIRTDWRAMHGLIFFALTAASAFVPIFRTWPLLWVVPLAAYVALVAAVPALRASFHPWRFGRVTRAGLIATLVLAVGSCVVLVAFDVLTHPDLGEYRGFLPVSDLGGLVAAGVIFPILNAFLEEVVFRGILFDAVESQWGARVAIVVTAGLFGYGHMHGYPPGPQGAVLAGIYGLCIGWLRMFTGGIGLGMLAHVAADATICVIVVRSGVF
jgi:membrane protease YdiL (CAAX protease family)